jgi:phospholipid/cholesterol/gamma-HCH transport system substrate-binding protein
VARQPSKTLIGAFVVGAVALATVGVVIFGSGRFFQKRLTNVMYFSGSITGLSVGSPVKFRGVQVGQVTKIAAVLDAKTVSITIPIYVELDPNSLIVLGNEDATSGLSAGRFYEPLLEKGLKAQLDVESFVTGKLYINMDFHPEIPPKLVGLDRRYPEIPTIPSLHDEILKTLHDLPEKIIAVAGGIERLVNSPAAQDSLRDLDGLLRSLTTEVGPLSASARSTLESARRAFSQGEKTLALKEGASAEMAASFTATMKKAGDSLDQMRSTLGTYQNLAEPSGNLSHDLAQTLGQVDAAARSVRALADYLELHPEAVLKGKQ